ncbi:hypothetical protein DPMN_026660 [Dreissena polymorpha]|uniref:Uncharacterized protein n=1 Tax=Dreissena polymorpha TaxID=45954 RepID=A0A9D4RCT3_DREPO|nr:hypothetical protein DPMN_026660 [Dreissena polymorpha]
MRFVNAPAPSLALTSSISVTAVPNLSYSTKHYRKRKLEAEQTGEFRRPYNKMLPYRSCNKRFEDRKFVVSNSSETSEKWKDSLTLIDYGKKKT